RWLVTPPPCRIDSCLLETIPGFRAVQNLQNSRTTIRVNLRRDEYLCFIYTLDLRPLGNPRTSLRHEVRQPQAPDWIHLPRRCRSRGVPDENRARAVFANPQDGHRDQEQAP